MKKDISTAEAPAEQKGALYQDPLHRASMPGRITLTTSGCENQPGFHLHETGGFRKPRCPLKGPHTDSVTPRHLSWALAEERRLGRS